MTTQPLVKVAVLDDYQNVALAMADWSILEGRAEVTVFNDHLVDPAAVIARLLPFEVVCVMRERTPLPQAILERLGRLRLIVSTGPRNASIDLEAARQRGITVCNTGYSSHGAMEMTWALIPVGDPLRASRDGVRARRRLAGCGGPATYAAKRSASSVWARSAAQSPASRMPSKWKLSHGART